MSTRPDLLRKYADILSESTTPQLDEDISSKIQQAINFFKSKLSRTPGFNEIYRDAQSRQQELMSAVAGAASGKEAFNTLVTMAKSSPTNEGPDQDEVKGLAYGATNISMGVGAIYAVATPLFNQMLEYANLSANQGGSVLLGTLVVMVFCALKMLHHIDKSKTI